MRCLSFNTPGEFSKTPPKVRDTKRRRLSACRHLFAARCEGSWRYKLNCLASSSVSLKLKMCTSKPFTRTSICYWTTCVSANRRNSLSSPSLKRNPFGQFVLSFEGGEWTLRSIAPRPRRYCGAWFKVKVYIASQTSSMSVILFPSKPVGPWVAMIAHGFRSRSRSASEQPVKATKA
jgi:hypothetical protein